MNVKLAKKKEKLLGETWEGVLRNLTDWGMGKPMKGLRGQAVLLDFFVSTVFFIIILATVFNTFNTVERQSGNSKAIETINSVAQSAAGSLLQTPGIPAQWTAASVSSIGLIGAGGAISRRKFLNLLLTDYYKAKSLLGAGAYDLYIRITDNTGNLTTTGLAYSDPIAIFSSGDQAAYGLVNCSGIVWDLYWHSNQPAPAGDYRYLYSDNNGPTLFDEMVANMSNYVLTVAYEPNVKSNQIDHARLASAIYNGSIFMAIGGQDNGNNPLIDGFNMSWGKYPPGQGVSGVVTKLDDLIVDVSPGDPASFPSPHLYMFKGPGDLPLNIIVNQTNPSAPQSQAPIASWNYGSGRAYYLTQYDGTLKGNAFSTYFNLLGNVTEFGIYPNVTTAQQISVVRRVDVLDTGGRNVPVAVDVIVYKN